MTQRAFKGHAVILLTLFTDCRVFLSQWSTLFTLCYFLEQFSLYLSQWFSDYNFNSDLSSKLQTYLLNSLITSCVIPGRLLSLLVPLLPPL